MPSLRMKKSSMCCSREKKCLRVCHKSTTISKRSCSHLKVSELAVDAGTSCQSCQSVFSSCEVDQKDTVTIGSVEECPDHQDMLTKQLPASFDGCGGTEEMEVLPDLGSTKFETIFSPTLSQSDPWNVQNFFNTKGTNVETDLCSLGLADESDVNSGSSSENQTCNISDFYISDMGISGLPFDGAPLCDEIVETLLFPEYDTAKSNIFFDAAERDMTLPFPDDSLQSCERLYVRPAEEARMNYDNSSFLLAIQQIRRADHETDVSPYVESDEAQYFDPHSFIGNLPDLSDVGPNGRPIILPKESQERKPITLVLDLDETLVHSTLERCEDANFTFTVFFNMKEHTVYVRERPQLHAFLTKVAEMFEIVVFTASQSIYAKQLLDILDPDGKIISGRAYRESCLFSEGIYTKDLTILGLNLAKVVIIDNSPQVFRLQVNNGIPIKSWFDDPLDNELMSLIPFLEMLADVDDVRPLIAKRFAIFEYASIQSEAPTPFILRAKEAGSTRFCMGVAWRDTIGRKTNFNQILDFVKEIRGMGMEVCCTLGMLEKQQAQELTKAGLTAYNHNLDTSREYYPKIITTRSYDERLQTLEHVREAGINVCCGGIIGMGETAEDRVGLLRTLATLPTHPESVSINALLSVKGTPLEDQKPVEIWEMIRMIATARIVMPKAMVRLSSWQG